MRPATRRREAAGSGARPSGAPPSGAAPAGPPIREIVDRLAERIGELAPELLPNGYRDKARWWRTGDIDDTAPRNAGSLVVNLTGAYRGWWKDFAGAEPLRDALELVAQARCGGDKRAAIRWAMDWLGLEEMTAGDRADQARRQAEARRRRAADARRAEADARARSRRAQGLFLAARPGIRDTPVECYLKGRAIDLDRLGRQPMALRFHPDCWCAETKGGLPAMLAAIHGPPDPSGQQAFLAVHRTYLAPDPRARFGWAKAKLAKAKMVLGPYAGGSIRLWRGETVDPETGETGRAPPLERAGPGEEVLIAEGIEDALSGVLLDPRRRALTSIAQSNLKGLWLPDGITGVLLAAQNEDNDTAEAAWWDAVATLQGRGLTVRDGRPPRPHKGLNEYLQHLMWEAS